ncbi:hypothetical protein GCM10009827_020590 [Dactylosporangium maewongense]|uniref:Uncharacterized protein n=1 Tax=Dactylosporangium maewongense TaxID=634393 RepID=A0ABN1ZXJ6_9ACTN
MLALLLGVAVAVGEQHNPHWRLPVREGVLPTLTVVDDTLDAAPERVALIVQDAREYAAKYLT